MDAEFSLTKKEEKQLKEIATSLSDVRKNFQSSHVALGSRRSEELRAFEGEYGFNPNDLFNPNLPANQLKELGIWDLNLQYEDPKVEDENDNYGRLERASETTPRGENRSLKIAEILGVILKNKDEEKLWKAYIAYEDFQAGRWIPEKPLPPVRGKSPMEEFREIAAESTLAGTAGAAVEGVEKLSNEARTILIQPYRPLLSEAQRGLEITDLEMQIDPSTLIQDPHHRSLYEGFASVYNGLKTPLSQIGLERMSMLEVLFDPKRSTIFQYPGIPDEVERILEPIGKLPELMEQAFPSGSVARPSLGRRMEKVGQWFKDLGDKAKENIKKR